MWFMTSSVLAMTTGCIVSCIVLAKPTLADDPQPSAAEALLKEKSLKLVDKMYILEDETAVGAKFRTVQTVYNGLQTAMASQAMILTFDQTLRNLQITRAGLHQEIDALNIQIDALPNRFNNRQLNLNSMQKPLLDQITVDRAQLNVVNGEITKLNFNPPSGNERRVAMENYQRFSSSWLENARELQELLDQTSNKYKELADDETVTKALNDVNLATKSKYKLGPSPQFRAAVRLVKGAKEATKLKPKPTRVAAKPKAKK